ncbi:RNA recognition motif domain-containing protein [Leptothoe sp. PORK10 BA2]|uniref:RNA recognition motif domain-containing protein n=1 Tax=Leptothoe sp. PORK10 BA2 TaxID=3110254 RepID=UPI002B1F8516|nr:RNA-binding protein [Leptothoe sp. PORK10 BA2]MEA5464400.1 RNA-binding protein [Leptothoe sp. PORK10 BA2]
MSIYVGNIAYNVSQEDLQEVFADYGTVKRVTVPIDRETNRPRGFAFVEMAADSEEDAAIEALDGAEWLGREIRVNKARPREERPKRPKR